MCGGECRIFLVDLGGRGVRQTENPARLLPDLDEDPERVPGHKQIVRFDGNHRALPVVHPFQGDNEGVDREHLQVHAEQEGADEHPAVLDKPGDDRADFQHFREHDAEKHYNAAVMVLMIDNK